MPNFLDYSSDLPIRSVPEGETALEEEVKDGAILILKSGKVEIVKNGTAVATISDPGSMLGEMAVLLGRGHTASAVAIEDCEFYVLEHAGQRLDANPKLYREIAQHLALRLMRQSEKNIELQGRLDADCEQGELARRMGTIWGFD
jgi:CRP-like cAMP-binding protein